MSNLLLTRDNFREGVFNRDNHTCVFCSKPAKDAHHILERRLWSDGGYYLDNGASVCEDHHILCETTEISVEQVRDACKITKIVLPEHLYYDQPYDKWGNPILPNGTRLKGELFHNASVQKILAQGKMLDLFTHWVKYPRTHHLPWSEGITEDDRILENLDQFVGKRVIATIKMDGENTTMYSDYFHARSLDGRNHPSRAWVKQFWSEIGYNIPEQWRVCGENLYAKHSIHYKNLETYFLGFSVWDDHNICLSWDDTLSWFELLGITPVKVVYDDIFDEKKIKALWDKSLWDTTEGYVLRVADSFGYNEFRKKSGKFVRGGHVHTHAKHWQYAEIEKNVLTSSLDDTI